MNAVPHILVADSVLRSLEWGETARAHMAAGAIAPDAYRVIPGLNFRDLHFRGRRGAKRLLRDFADTYVVPALARGRSDEQAFWAGWYCHILSDQVWRRMIRSELPSLWETVMAAHSDDRARLRDDYQAACDRIDIQLTQAPGSVVAEMRWLLRSWHPAYDTSPLRASQLREWVVQVGSTALPPPEPSLAGCPQIDFTFVQRAMTAATQQLVSEITELTRRAYDSPHFEDAFEEV